MKFAPGFKSLMRHVPSDGYLIRSALLSANQRPRNECPVSGWSPRVRPSFPRASSMKIFHCDHCDNLIFFENFQCMACNHQLAYLPDLGVIGSLDRGNDGLW